MSPARRTSLARAVGAAIRGRRAAAGLSLRAVCERMGEEPQHLCNAENGGRLPQLPRLIEIATALGCSAADIVRDAEQAL